MSSKTRGRRDHYLPQGYLRGFIHPDRNRLQRPLWVLDVRSKQWSERSPREIAQEKGFYDYPRDSKPDQTADQAFVGLEREFPRVRAAILKDQSDWLRHKNFLLNFGQMLRARSSLFREQVLENARSASVSRLTRLVSREPLTDSNATLGTWEYEDATPVNDDERQRLFKNKAITDMRQEIKKGP